MYCCKVQHFSGLICMFNMHDQDIAILRFQGQHLLTNTLKLAKNQNSMYFLKGFCISYFEQLIYE